MNNIIEIANAFIDTVSKHEYYTAERIKKTTKFYFSSKYFMEKL